MIVVNKKAFSLGFVMALGFGAVLVAMFLPILGGRTPLEAADDFFNSVSKDSSYYLPSLREHATHYQDAKVDLKLTFADADSAGKVAKLLSSAGAQASAAGSVATVKGQLGPLIGAALDDAEEMFHNRGAELEKTRGLPGKEASFAWWQALKQMNKQYRASGEYEKASVLEEVNAKGVEVSYNFYGIAPSPVSKNVALLTLALVFYLVYTMWWGYAIMYLCDGVGLQMKASGKREH